jgi:hypothetical protein
MYTTTPATIAMTTIAIITAAKVLEIALYIIFYPQGKLRKLG